MNVEVTEFTNTDFSQLSSVVCGFGNGDFTYYDTPDVGKSYSPQAFSCAILTDTDCSPIPVVNVARELISKYEEQYSVMCTLAAFYPAGGFIDWHDNHNFELYNVICTFSDTGDSFFEYKDTHHKIYRLNDPIGWSFKKTKWGFSPKVPHRAVSNCKRITVTFSSRNQQDILTLVENL